MLKYILTALVFIMIAVFAVVLAADLIRHRHELKDEPGDPRLLCVMAPIILLIATMGVSDFVMDTLFFKKCNLVDDKRLPGSLIAVGAIPLGIVGTAYLLSGQVDFKLVAVCMACQSVGTWIGAKTVSGWEGKRIKKAVAWAMLASAGFLLLRLAGIGGEGGSLTSFPLYKMVICGIVAAFLGFCSMFGMGAKAPYLSLLLMLGLSPSCVLPVVMPTCTVSGIVGGIQYVRKGLYQRKLALIYCTVGFIGIGAGFLFVLNLPEIVLQVIKLIITVYTGVSMLRKKD